MTKSDREFYFMVAAFAITIPAVVSIGVTAFRVLNSLLETRMKDHPVAVLLLAVFVLIGMLCGSTWWVSRAAEAAERELQQLNSNQRGGMIHHESKPYERQTGFRDVKERCGMCGGTGRKEEKDSYRRGLDLLSFPHLRYRVCPRCKGTGSTY
jgi:hypothetical protein